MNLHHYARKTDMQFIHDIAKAVNGEYSAIACYEQLARLRSDRLRKKRISDIRNDEIRRFHVFKQIYTLLTGKQQAPKQSESCANDYKSGLKAAFIDEQETVDFYLDLADKARDFYIKKQIRRAAADEQNHAVWFSYFLSPHR